MNFSRSIIHGEFDQKDAYRVILDSDIYLLETDLVNDLINRPENMIPMNQLLFDLYKKVLTEEFIKKLQKDTFEDLDIQGVEKNYE